MFRQILPATIVAALLIVASPDVAIATGYWNLPSNFCQCIGCGFGAGHHAPLVLGPANWDGICAHNEVRLPYAPSVPYSGCGCGDCGHDFAEPTLMDPTPAPVAPMPVPVTRRPRPLFLR